MNYTIPTTASALDPCQPPCDCTPSVAVRWFALVREAADAGDAELQALLPAVRDHADEVTAAAAGATTSITVPFTDEETMTDVQLTTDAPEDSEIMPVNDIVITGAPTVANPHS